MDFDSQSALRLRVLTYGVASVPDQFLLEEVDQVFRGVVCSPSAKHSTDEYLEAIREALASSNDLSEVIGLGHSNTALRGFLKALEQRIVAGC